MSTDDLAPLRETVDPLPDGAAPGSGDEQLAAEETLIHLDGPSRYNRQEQIGWWDQSLLTSARVLVVGAGALGNEVVKNLVLLGVGSILVTDMDTVEISNLSRCVFFLPHDEGRNKAEALAERASLVNPEVQINPLSLPIQAIGPGVAARATVMVGAVDNREARRHINRLSWWTGVPWVDGAMEALDGLSRVYAPPATCYECTLEDVDFALLAKRRSCRLLGLDAPESGAVPTSITTASIIAGIQAQEVVKIIHARARGEELTASGSDNGIRFFGLYNECYSESTPFDEDCLAHVVHEPVMTVDVTPATSLQDVAAAVGIGDGVVDLEDDHVFSWACSTCGTRSDDGRPVWRLDATSASCPVCDTVRQPDVRSSVQIPSDEASWPLERWERRLGDHLAVRSGLDYRYAALRSADEIELWR